MKWCCLSSCMLTDGNSSRRDNPTAGRVPWRVSDPWQAGAASTIESSKQPPLKYHPRTQCVTFWRISLAFVYTCDPLRLELMFQHALLMAHMTLFGAVLLCFASFFLSFFFFFGYLFLSISFLLASMSVWLGVDRVFFFMAAGLVPEPTGEIPQTGATDPIQGGRKRIWQRWRRQRRWRNGRRFQRRTESHWRQRKSLVAFFITEGRRYQTATR